MDFMKDDHLLQEVCKINAVQQIKASVESTLKCTAIVGASTFVGGLLGGRIGLTLGGIISSFVVGNVASSDLRPVPLIIYEMEWESKVKLANEIRALALEHKVTINQFLSLINVDDVLMNTLLVLLSNFLYSELGMKVKQ